MAIAKKPQGVPTATELVRQTEKFISGADKKQVAQVLSTTLRIPSELLRRIDSAAKRKSITRSAWIKATLSEKLDEEGVI